MKDLSSGLNFDRIHDELLETSYDDVEYCDDCGDALHPGKGCAIAHLPCAISSANESESAFVCEACFESIQRRCGGTEKESA